MRVTIQSKVAAYSDLASASRQSRLSSLLSSCRQAHAPGAHSGVRFRQSQPWDTGERTAGVCATRCVRQRGQWPLLLVPALQR